MVFIDIINVNEEDKIEELDDYIGNKNNKVFLLIFMEGCGPCNATRPEWKKIKNVLKKNNLDNKNIVIASIDHMSADKLKNLKTKPNSFPTMRFITDGGETYKNYEDSDIENKNRDIDSFIEWIETSVKEEEPSDNILGGKGTIKRKSKRHRRKTKSRKRKPIMHRKKSMRKKY